MELRWKASLSASCLHVAYCMVRQLPLANRAFLEVAHEGTELLLGVLEACKLDAHALLPELVAQASAFDNNRQLADIALRRALGSGAASEQNLSRLAAAIGGLETAVLAARPDLVDELALRGGPLQQQWANRGPGLLLEATRLAEEPFIAGAAEVVLLAPVVGGFGYAHPPTNRVHLEAVLADPHDDLPEVVRLAWLVLQVNAELPRYAEVVGGERLTRLAQLAAVPLALCAAEAVEWATCTPASIGRALECWHLADPTGDPLAEQLFNWWQTYRTGGSSWAVAWRALAALLAG
jgi:hypothetical protein